jgi:hypothetical protein
MQYTSSPFATAFPRRKWRPDDWKAALPLHDCNRRHPRSLDKLDGLLSDLSAWLAEVGATEPQFVFLGDYVDRGPDSKGVLERVRAMQAEGAICLRGNHEQMVIDATTDELALQNLLINGGIETLQSLETTAAFVEAQGWMRSLPTFYEDDMRYFVHAGVDPRRPLDGQTDDSSLGQRCFSSVERAFPEIRRAWPYADNTIWRTFGDARHSR